jgi:DivIVA domain-containing protein
MMWLFAVVVVLVIGGIAVVAAGGGDAMSVEYDDRPDVLVRARGALTGEDLSQLRFTTVLRGYRASEVDALLDRLAAQLDGETVEPS